MTYSASFAELVRWLVVATDRSCARKCGEDNTTRASGLVELEIHMLASYVVTKVRVPGIQQCSRDKLLIEAGQTVAAHASAERKVRAPQSRMPVNDRTP